MPRHDTKHGDRERSPPYDRRSHHHKHKYHGSDQKSWRSRDWDHNGVKERGHHYRDEERDFSKYRGRDDGRDNGRPRNREFNRRHCYDGDKRKHYSDGSYVKQKDISDNDDRSRSNSPSRSKSKRMSGFDMAPPTANSTLPGGTEQVPGVPQAAIGMLHMLPFQANQLSAFPFLQAQAMNQQATRHARRVYVGGLPPLTNEQTIAMFFSHVMTVVGGNSAGPGDAVVNVYINHEKKFAFVEMRTVEEASNAMALDGIIFEGVSVRVRRPTDYNPTLAAVLGPCQPSPHLNLSAAGLTPGMTSESDDPDRIFIGGLPYYFTEAQIKELLESFGPLRGFDVVKDRDTGNSKGYGFCVYKDPAVTDIACAALNGLKMGDKTLNVRRASTSSGQMKSEHEHILAQARQHIAIQKTVLEVVGVTSPETRTGAVITAAPPTKVLCLNEVITVEELVDDVEYVEILEDMKEEGKKFGDLIDVVIPRPSPDEAQILGVGKVFLEYADLIASAKAMAGLSGRKFGGNTVVGVYYPEDKYYDRDYGA